MHTIRSFINVLEEFAPLSYQESYDNAGLLTGLPDQNCTGVLCTLDTTEEVIQEARAAGCNLVVAHHPILFGGLKKINGFTYVEKALIAAIKNDIAIYAIHTNLDNVSAGVNGRIADKLGLIKRKVLAIKPNTLMKLVVFVPKKQAEQVRSAIFAGGGGKIGNYSECSFNSVGTGTFKPGEGSDPFVGEKGARHKEDEVKIEAIFPSHLSTQIITGMIKAHPYEEVAYDIIPLANQYNEVGSGLIGELEAPMHEITFLSFLKEKFNLSIIRHTPLLNRPVQKVALCGGSGSFLIRNAISAKADVYITSDVKYHEFFDANNNLVIADIGHYESEWCTVDLLFDILKAKFPTFALQKSKVKTNPVYYYI